MTASRFGHIDRRRLVASSTITSALALALNRSLLAQSTSDLATPEASPSASPVAGMANASSVPMFRGDAARTGQQLGPFPSLDEPIILKWRFFIEEYQTVGQPVLADGAIYVTGEHYGYSEGGNTYAIDAESGQELWRFRSGPTDQYWMSPAVVDGTVFVASDQLYALDARTGEEIWRFEPDANFVGTTPAIVHGTVYVQTANSLQALKATTGEETWRFSIIDTLVSFAPSMANGQAYVGSNKGTLFAVDAATGLERWRFSSEGEIGSVLPVVDDVVYFANQSDSVYALDTQTGMELWRFPIASYVWNSITVSGGSVFFVSDDYGLYALDAGSGNVQWRFNLDEEQWRTTEDEAIGSSPVVVDGVVFIVAGRTILAIDANSGTLLEQHSNDSLDGYSTFPLVVDGTLYIGWTDSICAVGNLPVMTIFTDTVLRGAPSTSGIERAQLKSGSQVRSTGNWEDKGGFSWLEVGLGEATGWIPLDAIDPATLPPEDIMILYEP